MLNKSWLRCVLVGSLLMLVGIAGVSADDHVFDRDGVSLHYRTDGTGQPAVLLGGGPGFDVDYMAAVGVFLPADYQRVFYEQRGTGRSVVAATVQAQMTLAQVVDDLEALRLDLKRDRLFLIGHSWGGMLAMAYAARYPQHIDRMILIGSGNATMEFTGWFDDNIRSRMRPEDLEAERHWDEVAARNGPDRQQALLESANALLPGYFFDRAKALAYARAQPNNSYHSDAMQPLMADLARAYDLRDGIRQVDRSVLIVHGHQDPMGDKTAEDLHALFKGSTLTYINRAGHFPWIEQPEAFQKAITDFCDSRR